MSDSNFNSENASDQQSLILPNPNEPESLFLLPFTGPVLFPTLIAPINVWHPLAIKTVEEVMSHRGGIIGLTLYREDQLPEPGQDAAQSLSFQNLFSFGVTAKILKKIILPDSSIQILVQAQKRFQVKECLSEKPYLVAKPEYFTEKAPEKDLNFEAMSRALLKQVKELSETHPFFNEDLRMALMNAPHTGVVIDIVAFALGLQKSDGQILLETLDIRERYSKVLVHLKREGDIAEIQKKISDEVNQKINHLQREFFLKEQLKLIKRELGQEVEGKEQILKSLREKIEALKLPEDTRKVVHQELEKFESLSEQSPDHQVLRTYLETVASLPWNTETEDQLDYHHSKEILDEDHLGLEKVKERILEFIATRKLKQSNSKNPKNQGAILLLVGPPGVGKTSIGKSIARTLNRKFFRFSLGGLRDEAEIKGHRKTYVGALPGKFIQALKRAESKNPVLLLDEIDKMTNQYRGDPASALLEVLDPEQNHNFLDHYLDLPFDLSQVIFIATANSLEGIPGPLLDRMEVIELSGYTFHEKEAIAKKHLVPRVLEKSGLRAKDIKFSTEILRSIIEGYAREPGLRNLEQRLDQIARKVSSKIIERQESKERLKLPIILHEENLVDYLGPKRFSDENLLRKPTPGVITGLAWTSMGGDVLEIECSSLAGLGNGSLKLTGKMGETMQESAAIAFQVTKKILLEEHHFDPKVLKETEVHLHIPAGAIPKDGPSAGITMATALLSHFLKIPPRAKIAMTGELSLTQRVLPIGGVKEKLLAAKRMGIEKVLLPKENQKDLHDIPDHLLQGLELQFVSTLSEVLDQVLFHKILSTGKTLVKAKKYGGTKNRNSRPRKNGRSARQRTEVPSRRTER